MIGAFAGALIVALVVTMIELTEVVALVFALGADAETIRHGALGAVAGVAVVAGAALAVGAALVVALPHEVLLWASAVVLAAFGGFLFRSTLRTYRRDRGGPAPSAAPPRSAAVLRFAGGFTVGAVETTEVVVVLLALTAAGQGLAAIVGSVVGGLALVATAAVVHERIRRVKTAWLKLGATSMVVTFSLFWAGEAAGVRWPGADLFLVPLFVLSLVVLRGAIAVGLVRTAGPGAARG